jgi:hypothetical protein
MAFSTKEHLTKLARPARIEYQERIIMNRLIESTPPICFKSYFSINKKNPNKDFQNVIFTLRGRDAISMAVKHFGLKKQDIVLLPGYLCKIIVDPFLDSFSPEYYDIGRDLSINTEVIESILCRHKVKVLYVIHYYGFLHRNIHELSRLCKKYGVLLWEDHAHSALSHFSYDYADAMIFSFRKVFPVPDGGGLWLAGSPSMKINHAGALSSNIISLLIFAKRAGLGRNTKFGTISESIANNNNISIRNGSKRITPQPISFMSRRYIKGADIESIYSIRRNIFLKWQTLFSNSPFKPVITFLPDDVCPYSFLIWVKNSQELPSKLWKFGVHLKNLWPLEDEMEAKCPTAFDLSKTLFSLPIYPGLLQSDMERIFTLVEQYGEPLPEDDC